MSFLPSVNGEDSTTNTHDITAHRHSPIKKPYKEDLMNAALPTLANDTSQELVAPPSGKTMGVSSSQMSISLKTSDDQIALLISKSRELAQGFGFV